MATPPRCARDAARNLRRRHAVLPVVRTALASILSLVACTHGALPARVDSPATMAHIPAGSYVTGIDSAQLPALLARYHTDHADLFTSEIPRRTVHVEAFDIDRTEATRSAFRIFLLANPAWRKGASPPVVSNGHYLEDWTGTDFPAGQAARPVAFVTWPAAAAYCAWRDAHLPTETEWEYAARGGLSGAEFPWGDEAPDSARANWGRSNIGHPVDVARYAPNGYGLYDMAGNVWEYTADPWPGSADRYAIRGGSYGASAINLRVGYRDSHPRGGAAAHVGFRCAR